MIHKELGISTESVCISPLSSATKRITFPDVPQDVDDLAARHWNDPNYDFDTLPSPTISSSDSFELEAKYVRKSSAGYSTSESDGESQVDSTQHSRKLKADPSHDRDSPYAEVRAAVSNIDDPSMPCNTFRMWTIGLLFAIFIPAFNQLLSLRYPNVLLSPVVAQLVALPMGKFLEWALPTTRFTTFGYTWSLNPGPFNIKEHTVVTVMAKVVEWGAYATDFLLSQQLFYGQKPGFAFEIMIVLSSQIMGYSVAGLTRQFLVWPSSMIWPGALVNAALFNTLHKTYGVRERGHMTRERFFTLAALASFIWYWVPGYLWTSLSLFNWVCWIAPANLVVNSLFGYSSGLGMGLVTFDWAMISYIGSPLITPWWSQANIIVSFVFFFWIITPIIYFTNTWYSAYMPISAISAFDNTGARYDIRAIVTNGLFDEEKYRNYSPVFLSATFAVNYCLALAGFTSVAVHTYLWYGRDIMRQFRRTLKDESDVHSRLMRAYPEVPHWWYGAIFVGSFIMGVVAIEKYHTDLPIWAFLICLVFGFMFVLPCGIILAITNQTITLNVLAELLAGYMIPGRPIAVMIFKTYGNIITKQASQFAGDLKLGHYMKVPPRVMYTAQTVATIVSCFVVVGVQNWALANIEGVCEPGQKDHFICPSSNTFATASLLYGGVGPGRLFGANSIYYPVIWFLLIGALSPIPFYFLAKKYPRSLFRYVNMPIFWTGPGALPPATGINYSSWAMAGFFFQYYMRRYRFMWWMRYNYILSTALDFGVAACSVLIFFTVVLPKGGFNLNWWGNTVYLNTADVMGLPLKALALGQTFGPSSWS